MIHLAEEDMVMHYYQEADDSARANAHLAECEECRRRFEELSKALQALTAVEVPERDDAYGARVWARLQPLLDADRERRPWWRALAAAMTWPRLAMEARLPSCSWRRLSPAGRRCRRRRGPRH